MHSFRFLHGEFKACSCEFCLPYEQCIATLVSAYYLHELIYLPTCHPPFRSSEHLHSYKHNSSNNSCHFDTNIGVLNYCRCFSFESFASSNSIISYFSQTLSCRGRSDYSFVHSVGTHRCLPLLYTKHSGDPAAGAEASNSGGARTLLTVTAVSCTSATARHG